MKKTIILSGMGLALFTAGLIFFANSGARNTLAVEAELNDKRASCPFFAENGTCGCVENGGTCNCGAEKVAGTCMGNGINRENVGQKANQNIGQKAEQKRATCGCQNNK